MTNRHLYPAGNDVPTKVKVANRSKLLSVTKLDIPDSRPYPMDKARPLGSTCLANPPAANGVSRTQPVAKRFKEENRDDAEMTLLDIDDFDTRAGVAQLMAVAPAIPIRDLYNLVIDSKGHFSKARERAIRMSEAPSKDLQNMRPLQTPQMLENDPDDDEILIKIDCNDPAFQWDTDEPSPEPVATRRFRPLKPGAKGKPTKFSNLQHAFNDQKRVKSEAKGQAKVTAKSTNPARSNPTHARETSSDRDFVFADNVIQYGLISDDDTGSSHRRFGDSNDEFDLDIDMQPHYAYNASILRKKRTRENR